MKNNKQINQLIDQIIEYNIYQDIKKDKEFHYGESWNVYHLKILKELINEKEA
jgi:hypothetical protein